MWFGAMDVTKLYKFIRFEANGCHPIFENYNVWNHLTNPINLHGLTPMDVTKTYKFIWFGAMDVTKPYKSIRFGANGCHQAL